MIEFEKPNSENVRYIADKMRTEDVNELLASSGSRPLPALVRSIQLSSHCAVAHVSGVPFSIYGMVRGCAITGQSVIWMLGTDDIQKYVKGFLKYSKIVVEEMLEISPELTNRVHVENHKSIRWLKYLGAEFMEPESCGVNGEFFSRFYLRKR